ncbi:MAG TPA: class I SAM-dependent methyltransferase [Thermoanaerobaculia bacterium]|nr:class I SAM-dependent methyltransferase [Thermoanaerobaculia bacterium]
MRPEAMTSVMLARCLHFANGLYCDRDCLDVGCGTGVQGIVMAIRGARHVVLSDVAPSAVRNTEENLHRFQLGGRARVVRGDLFECIDGDYDIIVFNHPFFVGHPSHNLRHKLETNLAAGAFINDSLEDPDLIHRFLAQARSFLRKGGTIVMPYYQLAGAPNDPAVQGPRHGYKVFEHFRASVVTGLQRGVVSVYRLAHRNSR